MYVVFRRQYSFYVFRTFYRSLRSAGRDYYLPISFDSGSVSLLRRALSHGSEGLFRYARVSGVYGSYLVIFLLGRALRSGLGLYLGDGVFSRLFQVSSFGGSLVFIVVLFCWYVCVYYTCDVCELYSFVCQVDVCFPSRFGLYLCFIAFDGDGVSRIIYGSRSACVTTFRRAGYYARPKDSLLLSLLI